MKKVAIISNASSGKRLASQFTFGARSQLWGRKCEFHFPTTIEELHKTVSTMTTDNYEALVVIGGDGTINQVIRAIQNQPHPVPIYPFPAGTANDLANELGLRADWNQVQTLIDEKQHYSIDLIEVNKMRFATVGGIGVGPIFTEKFNRWRKESPIFRTIAEVFHSQIYALLAVNTIITRRDYVQHLHIRGSGFDEKMKTPAVFLCNQASIGGNIKVAPPIDNTDRRFNVLIIRNSGQVELLKAMAEAKMGKIPSNAFVFSTDHLLIQDLNFRSIPAFGDGEPLTSHPELEFKILPKSLRVYGTKNIF
jgi:diacylglycerol kinase (ATP)